MWGAHALAAHLIKEVTNLRVGQNVGALGALRGCVGLCTCGEGVRGAHATTLKCEHPRQ